MVESSRDVEALLAQAKRWEESGEYERAVESYLKVDRNNSNGNTATMASAWTKAAELAIKFLDSDKAIDVAQTAGPMLVEVLSTYGFSRVRGLKFFTLYRLEGTMQQLSCIWVSR